MVNSWFRHNYLLKGGIFLCSLGLISGGFIGCKRDVETSRSLMYEMVRDIEIDSLRTFFDVLVSVVPDETLAIVYKNKLETLYTHERILANNEVSWYIVALARFYSGGPFDHFSELDKRWDVRSLQNRFLGILYASIQHNQDGSYGVNFDGHRVQILLRSLGIELDQSLSLLQRKAERAHARNFVEIIDITTD